MKRNNFIKTVAFIYLSLFIPVSKKESEYNNIETIDTPQKAMKIEVEGVDHNGEIIKETVFLNSTDPVTLKGNYKSATFKGFNIVASENEIEVLENI